MFNKFQGIFFFILSQYKDLTIQWELDLKKKAVARFSKVMIF